MAGSHFGRDAEQIRDLRRRGPDGLPRDVELELDGLLAALEPHKIEFELLGGRFGRRVAARGCRAVLPV